MNRIFIFEYVDGITDQYHDGGGLAIITASGDPVQLFRDAYPDLDPDFAGADQPVSYILADNIEERIFVFPDVGCC